jgi:hypothetical protein
MHRFLEAVEARKAWRLLGLRTAAATFWKELAGGEEDETGGSCAAGCFM